MPRDGVGILAFSRRIVKLTAVVSWTAVRVAALLLAGRLRGAEVPSAVLIARALGAACERLNGAFLKGAQLLGTRHDLFPPEVLEEFRRLHDRVRPASPRAITSTVEAAFGRELDQVFMFFDPAPHASGSIAQVHRARLRGSDRDVAVKVIRPDVREAILIDTRLMKLATTLVAHLPVARDIALAECVNEIADAVRGQLDLRREGETYRRLRDLLGSDTRVSIPVAYEELTCATVLVMDFVGDLRRIDCPTLPIDMHKRALDTLLAILYRTIFDEGIFHCDLHPGNVLVGPDGGLVLVDMGMIAELSPELRTVFRNFFLSVALNRGARAAAILQQSAVGSFRPVDERAFEADITTLVREASHASAGTFQVARFTAALFDVQRRHGLKGSPQFTLAILALLSFEGLAKQRYGDLDFLGLAITMAVQGTGATDGASHASRSATNAGIVNARSTSVRTPAPVGPGTR